MTTLSIKFKVIAVIVGALAIGGGGLTRIVHVSHQATVAEIAQNSLRTARISFSTLSKAQERQLASSTELLMANKELRDAYAARDREKLITATQPLYDRLKKQYGVTILNYIDPDEKRYVNMTDPRDPKLFGKKAVRFNVQDSVKTKTWSNGIALGRLGLALRATHPLWTSGTLKGDQLLGYLELGSEIGGLLDTIKQQSHNDYGLLALKKHLKAEDWAAQRAALKLPNNWADDPNTVLAGNTSSNKEILRYSGDIEALPDDGLALGVLDQRAKHFARSVFPIRDVSSAKIGAMFVLVDVTPQYEQAKAIQQKILLATGGLMVFLTLSLVLLLNQLVFKRLARITELATNVVGGDFKTPLQVSSDDEIGQFEALFEQFRAVFVGVLDDMERLMSQQKPPDDQS